MSLKYTAIRTMFEALWLSRLPALVRTLSSARGVIFTLHRVLPGTPPDFAPNAILQVRPAFLDYVIERLRHLGVEPVTLDDAIARLAAPAKGKPFAVFTFDDAYKDNREHALPILERHDCPFTLYVPTALVDGTGEVWWQALEDIIRANNQISFEGGDAPRETLTTIEKQSAYNTLYWRMRTMPEAERVALLHSFASRHGFDLAAHCASLIMNWDELATIAAHPLCTIGAHTVHHYELAKLPPQEARAEMLRSADIIAQRLGRRPTHLSYPIGGPTSAGEREFAAARELGFASGVTTRPGGLYPRHAQALHALPRVSLNGLFQQRRYVDVFATGALFTWLGRIGA